MNLASLADAPQLPRADHIADDPPRPHEESSRFQSWPHRFFSASSRCPLPVFIFLRSSLRVSREGGAVTPYTVTGIYISSRDRDHEIPRNNTKICGPALSFLGDASLLSASDVERRSRAILRAFPPHARVSRTRARRTCLPTIPRTCPAYIPLFLFRLAVLRQNGSPKLARSSSLPPLARPASRSDAR